MKVWVVWKDVGRMSDEVYLGERNFELGEILWEIGVKEWRCLVGDGCPRSEEDSLL